MFKGRKIIIATKHKKEDVITPLLEKNLGVKSIIPEDDEILIKMTKYHNQDFCKWTCSLRKRYF
jgi:hypothetical protein